MKTQILSSTAALALMVAAQAAVAQTNPAAQPNMQSQPSTQSQMPRGEQRRDAQTQTPQNIQPAQQNAQQPAPSTGQSTEPNRAQTSQPAPSTQSVPQSTQQSSQPPAPSTGQAQQPAQQPTAQQPSTQQQSTQQPAQPTQRNVQQPQAPAGQQTTQQPAPTTQQNTQQPAPSTQQNAQQPATQQGAQSTTGAASSGVVSLNAQQRNQLGQVIARANVEPLRNVNFSISVGTVVPRTVQIRALPSELVTIVPQYRGYSYFVVEEQIVIVEPSSHKIVAVVPYARGSASTTRSSRKLELSREQREVVRRHATQRRSGEATTTRRATRSYEVGEEVPRSVTVERFTETIEVPEVRRYRYFTEGNDVMLVDPDEDRVIEIIR